MELRKNDANYLAHVERWFNVLLPRMAPYLYHRGGPILMTQVCPLTSEVTSTPAFMKLRSHEEVKIAPYCQAFFTSS